MNFAVISTEIFILCLGLFAIVMDLVLPAKESHKSIGAVLIFALTGWFLYMFTLYQGPLNPMEPEAMAVIADKFFYQGMYFVDNYALFFKQMFIWPQYLPCCLPVIMFSLCCGTRVSFMLCC